MRAGWLFGLLLAVSLIASACGQGAATDGAGEPAEAGGTSAPVEAEKAAEPGEAASNIRIAASFYPMYEFVSNVAGDYADVTLLVPAGMEPHDWEPSPQDMALLESADVLVVSGAGMETWVSRVTDSLSNERLTVVEASAGIALLPGGGHDHDHGHSHGHEGEHGHDHDGHEHEGHTHEDEHDHEHEGEHSHEGEHAHEEEHAHEHDHDHGEFDPHVWLSPAKAIEQVRAIEAALAAADPSHADDFRRNADAYVAELTKLHERYQEALAPYAGREFVTQHAAFGYLAHEYNLEQLPIAGLSPEHEPSAQRMAEIVELAKEHDIRTIFFETLVSSKVAETIAAELGAKTAVLHPVEGLTKEEAEQGLTYIALMERNLESLLTAFAP